MNINKEEKNHNHEPRQFESFSLEARSSKGFAFPYNIQYITKPVTFFNDNSNTNNSSDDDNNNNNILSITIIYYYPQRRRVHLRFFMKEKIYICIMYIYIYINNYMYLCRISLLCYISSRARRGYLQ